MEITTPHSLTDTVWFISNGIIWKGTIEGIEVHLKHRYDRYAKRTVYTIKYTNANGSFSETTREFYQGETPALFLTKQEAGEYWLRQQGLSTGIVNGK